MRPRFAAIAACAGNACAYAIVNTTPLVLGALMQGLGLDEAAAGLLMTAALLTMGLVALGCAPFLTGSRKRRVALAAAVVIVCGEASAALCSSDTWMMLWMLMIGAGAGALLAAVNAIIAASSAPDRLFGHALMSAYAAAALLVFGLAPAIEIAGHHGAFATLAAFSLASLPLLRGLPRESAGASTSCVAQTSSTRAGLALLLGIVTIGIPMMGFYAFIDGIGTRLQIDPGGIAQIFGAQQIASVAGALLAARMGTRIGLRRGIMVGTVLHTAAIACAVLGGSMKTFAFGVVAEGFSFLFLLPVLFTLAALLDVSGRWAAAANGALFIATGVAPALVGALITQHGYDSVAWLMLLATPLGLLAFTSSARTLEEQRAGST